MRHRLVRRPSGLGVAQLHAVPGEEIDSEPCSECSVAGSFIPCGLLDQQTFAARQKTDRECRCVTRRQRSRHDRGTSAVRSCRPHPSRTGEMEESRNLWVHYSPCADPTLAEQLMVNAFVSGVPTLVSSALVDPAAPLPFANLEFPGGRRKRHGISGVKERRPETTLGS